MNQILRSCAVAVAASALMLHSTAQAASVDVLIEDTGFSPVTVTVNQGDEVFWFNNGTEVHSAKAANGEWNSGRIPPLDCLPQ